MRTSASKWTVGAIAFLGAGAFVLGPVHARAGGMYGSESPSAVEQGSAVRNETAKVNLNTASAREIAAVPGIGLERAKAIVEYRDSNGPLYWLGQLRSVRGFDKAKLAQIQDEVTVW